MMNQFNIVSTNVPYNQRQVFQLTNTIFTFSIQPSLTNQLTYYFTLETKIGWTIQGPSVLDKAIEQRNDRIGKQVRILKS